MTVVWPLRFPLPSSPCLYNGRSGRDGTPQKFANMPPDEGTGLVLIGCLPQEDMDDEKYFSMSTGLVYAIERTCPSSVPVAVKHQK